MLARAYSVSADVGRLVYCRIRSPIDLPEVAAFGAQLRELLPAVAKGGKIVICVDIRRANVFPPEVADGFIGIMRSDNALVERSGFLVGKSALFSLQIERLIRDAQNPARRAFHDVGSLVEWLAEVLSPPEKSRLEALLDSTS